MEKKLKFATQKAADDFAESANREAGYPRDGVNVGDGIHVPAEQSRTLRLAEVVFDEAELVNKYTYTIDDAIEAKVLAASRVEDAEPLAVER